MQSQTLRIIMVILVTSIMMLYFYTDREKNHYLKASEPAIRQILTEISSWEKQALLIHLTPEAKQAISDEQLDEMIDFYRNFGQFRSIQELIFSRIISALSLIGEKRINYSGTANFDAGLVNFNITLVERGGIFLIYNFTLTKALE